MSTYAFIYGVAVGVLLALALSVILSSGSTIDSEAEAIRTLQKAEETFNKATETFKKASAERIEANKQYERSLALLEEAKAYYSNRGAN